MTRNSTGALKLRAEDSDFVFALPGELGYNLQLPIRAESEANKRGHWAKKARRAKSQRSTAALSARAYLGNGSPGLPLTVRLVRIAPRMLDDDNLRGALKAVRDGIADWIGIDDRDPRVTWDYGQEKGEPKQYAVRVEIRFAEAA